MTFIKHMKSKKSLRRHSISVAGSLFVIWIFNIRTETKGDATTVLVFLRGSRLVRLKFSLIFNVHVSQEYFESLIRPARSRKIIFKRKKVLPVLSFLRPTKLRKQGQFAKKLIKKAF